MAMIGRPPVHAKRRFWAKVSMGDECWEWLAGKDKDGYGRFRHGKEDGCGRRAHMFSWINAFGPIPTGLIVCHKCDNPGCVRPGHLFLGTHKDNTNDKIAKGRDINCRGDRHWAHRKKMGL